MAVSRLLLYPERPLAKRICWTLWALQHGAPWGSVELHGAPWSSKDMNTMRMPLSKNMYYIINSSRN